MRQQDGAAFSISPAQDAPQLLDKLGVDSDTFADEFGFPIEQLTGSEVYRYANLEKGIDSPASLRSRILKSGSKERVSGNRSGDGSTGTTGTTASTSFSIGRATVTPSGESEVFRTADGRELIGPAAFSIGDYRIAHQPNSEDASIEALEEMFGDDIYGPNAIRYCGADSPRRACLVTSSRIRPRAAYRPMQNRVFPFVLKITENS